MANIHGKIIANIERLNQLPEPTDGQKLLLGRGGPLWKELHLSGRFCVSGNPGPELKASSLHSMRSRYLSEAPLFK